MRSQKNTARSLITSALSFLLISTFLFVSLVAFSGINKSAAWFANVKDVSAEGMSVVVDSPYDVYADVTSYAVSEISEVTGTPSYTTYTATSKEAYTLPTVDPGGIIYNEYENALVVVLEITSTKAQRLNISLVTPNSTVSYASDNYISNCMQISEASFDASSRVATVTKASQHFVDISNENSSKVASINLTPNGAASITVQANVKTTLCFVIEYHDNLMTYLDNPREVVTELFFNNDITFVVTSLD